MFTADEVKIIEIETDKASTVSPAVASSRAVSRTRITKSVPRSFWRWELEQSSLARIYKPFFLRFQRHEKSGVA